jgi:hypothetical protein
VAVSIPDIVEQLHSLPPARVAEVYDFVLFLKSRELAQLDESDEWSDEDLRDVIAASLRHVEPE